MIFFSGFPFFFFLPLIFVAFGIRLLSRFLRSGGKQDYRQLSPREEFLQRYIPNIFDPRVGTNPEQSPEATIFKLAYKLKGRVTVSDLVIETGLPVDDAEKLIQQMIDGSRVKMEVDDRGMISYEFPEIMARFDRADGSET
ncbi:MAG TPA: hypothetical protein VMW87_15160 [Spirochaetia bacterium]|nr:hypothetical protein [Spirochaetia bacterium]